METQGKCSPVVIGNKNVINCGSLSKKDAQLIAEILNQLLLSNESLSTIKEKLNEALNPYHPVIRYELNGWSVTMRGGEAHSDPAENPKYVEMLELEQAKSWARLLDLSLAETRDVPDWITPYFFVGASNLWLCKRKEALAALATFDKKSEGLENFGELQKMSKAVQDLIATGQVPPTCGAWLD